MKFFRQTHRRSFKNLASTFCAICTHALFYCLTLSVIGVILCIYNIIYIIQHSSPPENRHKNKIILHKSTDICYNCSITTIRCGNQAGKLH